MPPLAMTDRLMPIFVLHGVRAHACAPASLLARAGGVYSENEGCTLGLKDGRGNLGEDSGGAGEGISVAIAPTPKIGRAAG